MNYVKIGAILPHPPIIVPFIGKNEINKAKATQEAMKKIAKRIKELESELDAIIVITPHGVKSLATVPVYCGHTFEGGFANFNVPKPSFSFKGMPELAIEIVREAGLHASRTAETFMDHGVLVPMYYPLQEKVNLPIVPIAIGFLSLKELYEFGKIITKAAEKLGKRITVIASADMSHCKDIKFDQKLVDLIRNYDIKGILGFPAEQAERAEQDALWSIAILLGALDGANLKPEVFSYESPFGVGYMVVQYEQNS